MTLMRKDNKNDKNYKVQYLPIGMCLGLSIGAALGNISMGICIGLAIGAGIDFLHNKKNDGQMMSMKNNQTNSNLSHTSTPFPLISYALPSISKKTPGL